MARRSRRTGRKRGRPRGRNPNARRYQTTRAGRRGEVDRGSELLRVKKLAVTSRFDIEMSAGGVLFGRGHLDREQYDKLSFVTELRRRIARSFGRDASPAGVWLAIVAAASRTRPGMPTIVGDQGARRALENICRRLDGSHALVLALAQEGSLPPICVRAAEHRLTLRDSIELEILRKGLDEISPPRSWVNEAL